VNTNMVAQDLLHELFEYKNGNLIRKVRTAPSTKVGDVAGCHAAKGYIQVRVKGRKRSAHRLIWIMRNGDIPEGLQIDHINGVKDDNRIENLRLVTNQENQFNRKVNGCSWHKTKNKWGSYIGMNYKLIHLGMFDTEQEAHQAYLDAKYELHIIKERVA